MFSLLDLSAKFSLGDCLEEGRGVAKDEAQAVEWYRKAAAQGYADAEYNLGLCLELGKGVKPDQVGLT